MIFDVLVVIIVLSIFGLVSMIANGQINDLTTMILAEDDIAAEAKTEITSLDSRFDDTFDDAFVLAFGLLWLFVVVSAFLIDTHPAFFIVSLIMFVAVFLIGGYMTEVWESMLTDDLLSSQEANYPKTTFVMSNLLFIVLGVGASIAIALFAKSR